MQIQTTAIERLRPYPRNARTHSKNQIRKIARSLERFGFCNPVLVDADGQIIAGHGRVEAAKLLGLKQIPTVELSHLSDADKRAYILADNKLALEAGWDREMLATELQGLLEVDYEIELTGFSTPEIDIVIEDAREAAEPEQAEDTPPARSQGPAVSQSGDVWILGPHVLLCGDARNLSSYDSLLNGEKAVQVFSDPPYNIKIEGHVSGHGRTSHDDFAMACGEMTEQQFTAFLEQVFRLLAENTTNGSIDHLCMDWRHAGEMIAAGRRVYTELKNICVWNKTNAGLGSFYRSKHELIFVWKNGTAPHVNNFELGQHGRHRTNVWDYSGANTTRAGRMDDLSMHATIKPVALVADALKDCSAHGDLVLDPFCGSGSIIIAAERTGRRARAIELDPAYVDVAVRRWQAFSGKQATLKTTKQSFEQVEDDRRTATALA